MRIEELTAEKAQEYRDELAELYYGNIRLCSYLDHYGFDDAYEKIGDFIFHLHNNTAVGFVLINEGVICGFIWAYPHRFREEDRMYVNEIRVKDDYRDRGYGKALLQKVEERTQEMGIGAIYMHAEADNPDAIKLYETCGYHTERIQLRKEIDIR